MLHAHWTAVQKLSAAALKVTLNGAELGRGATTHYLPKTRGPLISRGRPESGIPHNLDTIQHFGGAAKRKKKKKKKKRRKLSFSQPLGISKARRLFFFFFQRFFTDKTFFLSFFLFRSERNGWALRFVFRAPPPSATYTQALTCVVACTASSLHTNQDTQRKRKPPAHTTRSRESSIWQFVYRNSKRSPHPPPPSPPLHPFFRAPTRTEFRPNPLKCIPHTTPI